MTDLTESVKRKPGRPRKHPVVETIDAQAQAVVGVEAAERADSGVVEDGQLSLGTSVAGVANATTARGVGGDWLPGLRKGPGLAAAELETLQREAWEAFDYDAPRGKTDSIGRIWAFDPDIKGGVKTVDISVRRVGGLRHGTKIQVPEVGYQDARPAVEQIVNRLNGELP